MRFRSSSCSTILRTPTRVSSRTWIIASSPRSSHTGIIGTGWASPARPCPTQWTGTRSGRGPRTALCHVHQPCAEKGVYAFARIAHELGRRRPDIPLLVVESRGTPSTWPRAGSTSQPAISRSCLIPLIPGHSARDQDRPHAFTLVGESTPRGHRGHDQRDPRDRLQSRRHPGDPRRKRVCTSSAESPDALDQNRALRRGSRALGRDDHPPVG